MREITLALLLAGTAVHAQQVYTLDMCRDTALKYNRAIAIAGQAVEAARHAARAYRAGFLPRFSASGAYLYTTSRVYKRVESAYLPTFVPDPATGQLKPDLVVSPGGSPVT